MSKISRSSFTTGAAQALSHQNFPAVYKNAIAALALGDVRATYFLCAYHHHQMLQLAVTGPLRAAEEATANFLAMYQLAEYYNVKGYTYFTHNYQVLFDQSNALTKKVASELGIGYTKYLQTTQMQYSEATAVDIRTAEHLASTMEQSVTKQAISKSQAPSFEMSAPLPHGYDYSHARQQEPLLGQHNHEEKCWDKLHCAIL